MGRLVLILLLLAWYCAPASASGHVGVVVTEETDGVKIEIHSSEPLRASVANATGAVVVNLASALLDSTFRRAVESGLVYQVCGQRDGRDRVRITIEMI